MVCFLLSKEMTFIPSQQAEIGNRNAYIHMRGCVCFYSRTYTNTHIYLCLYI